MTKTDDLVDGLAGACFGAINFNVNKLPRTKTAYMPAPSEQNIVWRNMQGGTYGSGPGGQVAAKLEQRASWPKYKR